MGQGPGKFHPWGFQLPSCGGVMASTGFPGNDMKQRAWNIANQGISTKPWHPEILLGLCQ